MEYFRALSAKIVSPRRNTPPTLRNFTIFEKAWLNIQVSEYLRPDSIAIKTHIPQDLQILSDYLLQEEIVRKDSGDPTTGICMEYFLNNNILENLVELAEPDLPRGFRCEVMRTISNLVNLLDESFLQHKTVHKAILYIFQYYSKKPKVATDYILDQTEADLPRISSLTIDPPSSFEPTYLRHFSHTSKQSSLYNSKPKAGKLGLRGWAPAPEIWQTTGKERAEWEKRQLEFHNQDFVELMYMVCSKIHGFPDILGLFFYDHEWLKAAIPDNSSLVTPPISETSNTESSENLDNKNSSSSPKANNSERSLKADTNVIRTQASDTKKKPRFEFYLFTNLLQFIYYEGKIGDYCRTALLFILELAYPHDENTSSSTQKLLSHIKLEQFILEESGFSLVICASLAAVYSQLAHRVSLFQKKSSGSQQRDTADSLYSQPDQVSNPSSSYSNKLYLNPVSTQSHEFTSKLISFSQTLNFIQDIYYRTPSSNIKKDILLNFKNYFLSTVFYPSILESNDTDGSGVAVMIYLDTMLQTFTHSDFGNLIFTFFNYESEHDTGTTDANLQRSLSLSNDTKDALLNLDNLSGTSNLLKYKSPTPSVLQFTIRDLICTNTHPSSSSDSIVTSLKLLKTITTVWCPYTLSSLFEFEHLSSSGVSQVWLANHTVAVKIHKRELEMYGELVINLESGAKAARYNRLGIRSSSFSPDFKTVSGSSLPLDDKVDTEVLSNNSNLYFNNPTRSKSIRSQNQQKHSRFNIPKNRSFYIGFISYLNDAHAKWHSHISIHENFYKIFSYPYKVNAQAGQDHRPESKHEDMFAEPVSEASKELDNCAIADEDSIAKEPNKGDQTLSDPYFNYYKNESGEKNCFDCVERKIIKDSDPLLRNLLSLLSRFFTLSSECNLALTGVIASLVCCPLRVPDGWLVFDINSLLRDTLNLQWEKSVSKSKEKVDHLSYPDKTNLGVFVNQNTSADTGIYRELSDSEGELEDLSALRKKSKALAIRIKSDLGSLPSLGNQSTNDRGQLDPSIPKRMASSRIDRFGLHQSGDTSPSSLSTSSQTQSIPQNDPLFSKQNFLFSEFEGLILDTELENAVASLPSGATKPLLYAVLCTLVDQASTIIPFVPDYKKRLRNARNALMGIVDFDQDIEMDSESEADSNKLDSQISETNIESLVEQCLSQNTSHNEQNKLDSESPEFDQDFKKHSSNGTIDTSFMQKDDFSTNANDKFGASLKGKQGINSHSSSNNFLTSNPDSGKLASNKETENHLKSPDMVLKGTSLIKKKNKLSIQSGAMPPSNINMKDFLENVIILQESIKEIVAFLQTRREDGCDDNSII
ncbi:hypothetical protein BB560_004398 [Smittium megazygosporum]|uniref:FHF complex subunit HOOK-interacting protein C-terminal domain-containing protein n=1 Tax=Smittium megazygosporum TaxID=133381 RepID=A0A2T9Z9C1_9FUNG|nr:hypothetical protein BB560_004398 [Smittium megazygosporum]